MIPVRLTIKITADRSPDWFHILRNEMVSPAAVRPIRSRFDAR